MTLKSLKYILIATCLWLFSCNDDFTLPEEDAGRPELRVTCSINDFVGSTRSLGDQTAKIQFEEGNSIHISATFNLSDGTTSTGYALMIYGNGKWTQAAGSALYWPDDATGGTFQAFYMPGNQDDLLGDSDEEGVIPLSATLSGIAPDDDPLVSEVVNLDKYGQAIHFNFKHLCTYLTLTDLEPGIPTLSYWFTRPELQEVFNNAYRLVRRGNALSFEFYQDDNAIFPAGADANSGLVYISSYVRKYPENASQEEADLRVGFFLEPGLYDTFTIQYPGATQAYPYLSYNYNDIPAAQESTVPQLKAGFSYILDIRKSQGIQIDVPEEEETWDDSEAVRIDVKSFLESANQGIDYDELIDGEMVRILEALDNGTGVKLLKNVDFEFKDYTFFPEGGPYTFFNDFSKTFDGGHHKIVNLGSPLFHSVSSSGVVKNLWLQTIDANVTSNKVLNADNTESKEDFSSIGLICGKNQGTLVNIRVEDLAMTVNVKSDSRNEAHNIGCLVGSNNGGDLHEIELMGNFSLTVQNSPYSENTEGDNSEIYIGGLIGQVAGNTDIYEIGPSTSNFSLTITNTCNWTSGLNQRAYYIGGLMGLCSGYMNDVTLLNVTIDSSRSEGMVSFMGGMGGSFSATTDSRIMGCVVSGKLMVGKIVSVPYFTCGAYTGGLVGRLQGVNVQNCRSTMDVYGPTDYVAPELESTVTYATGGAFGAIVADKMPAPSYVEGIVAYGAVLNGHEPFEYNGFRALIGNFAGMVPDSNSWDDFRDNALVRKFPDYRMIGNVAD